MRFKYSKTYKNLLSDYDETVYKNILHNNDVHYFDQINSPDTHDYFKDLKFDVGELGGIGILSVETISCFKKMCINAHPAPFPQCQGG
jgi:hypothetical protein